MLQNTMLTRFLRLGSFFLILFFTSCEGQTDYWVRGDWIYINKTEYIIEVKDRPFNSFKLPPDSTYIYEEGGIGSIMSGPNDYGTPYLGGFTIIVDNKDYFIQVDEGIANIANYEAEKVERNYYRFTYVFNEDTIPKDSE